MLNKDEELRLAGCIDVARNDVRISAGESSEYFHSDLTVETVLWLAEKLKECNDALKENEEVRKKISEIMNKSWKDHWEYNKEEDN